MDSRENPAVTESFDLLFRGLEVTTGGQRIHNYREQVEKIESRGMHVEAFESYLMMHRCGMPRTAASVLGWSGLRHGFSDLKMCGTHPCFKRHSPSDSVNQKSVKNSGEAVAQIHGLSRSFIRFPSLLKESVTVWIFLLYTRGVKMTNCLLQTGLLYKSQNFCRNEPCKASENRLY